MNLNGEWTWTQRDSHECKLDLRKIQDKESSYEGKHGNKEFSGQQEYCVLIKSIDFSNLIKMKG